MFVNSLGGGGGAMGLEVLYVLEVITSATLVWCL